MPRFHFLGKFLFLLKADLMLAFALLLISVTACSRKPSVSDRDVVLCRLDSLIEVDPDSAFACLSALNIDTFSYANLSYYTYLRTRAADKTYVPITWLQDMRRAAGYYEMHCSREETAMAYYYLAMAYEADQQFFPAVKAMAKSIEFQDGKATRMLAFCYSTSGDCCYKIKLSSEAINQYKKAEQIAIKICDRQCLSQIYDGISAAYLQQENKKDALAFAFVCLDIANEVHDSLLMSNQFNRISLIYEKKMWLDSAYFYLIRAYEMHPKRINSAHLDLHKANLFYETNQLDSAEILFNRALSIPTYSIRSDIYSKITKIAAIQCRQNDAIAYKDSASYYKSLQLENDQDISIMNFFVTQMVDELENRMTVTWLVSITIVIFALLFWFIEYKRRMKRQIHCTVNDDIEDVECEVLDNMEVYDHKDKSKNLHSYYQKMQRLESHINLLTCPRNTLTAQILDSEYLLFDQTEGHKILSQFVLDKKISAVIHKDQISIIKHSLETSFAKSIECLRQDSYSLNFDDCVVCILSYGGYETAIIAAILYLTNVAIRKRKSRLKKKLSSEDFQLVFHL